jgi:hypothetical protein
MQEEAVTFKDLQRLVQSESGPQDNQLLHRLRDKQFWIWDREGHKQADRDSKGDCCFYHIIGLPTKDGLLDKGDFMPKFQQELLQG